MRCRVGRLGAGGGSEICEVLGIFGMKSVVYRSPVMLTVLGRIGIIERKFCETSFGAMREGGIVDS